jgi:Hydrolase of X-linked nucleoside diphosphate N terminal
VTVLALARSGVAGESRLDVRIGERKGRCEAVHEEVQPGVISSTPSPVSSAGAVVAGCWMIAGGEFSVRHWAAVRLAALAQNGLVFATDDYDRDRCQQAGGSRRNCWRPAAGPRLQAVLLVPPGRERAGAEAAGNARRRMVQHRRAATPVAVPGQPPPDRAGAGAPPRPLLPAEFD